MTDTIQLLMQGDAEITLYDKYRDLVLFIGNKMVGKSTLAIFAGGSLADLDAIHDDNDGDDFMITSQTYDWINLNEPPGTLYPNLIIDPTNIAFYDCPPLNSMEMKYEIAAKFFLKKVVDHSKSLKLVLVADYKSVKDVDSTKDFHELMQSLYLFMNYTSNYKDAISFVATKVEPGTSNEDVVNNIVQFFKAYRAGLSSNDSSSFNKFAVLLMDILLTKNGNAKSYDKISIFRKPNADGPLNKIRYMVEDRKMIRDMIINRTRYASRSNSDDFTYTISSSSELQLFALVEKLNEEIKERIHKIGDVIASEFQGEAQRLGNLKQMAERFEQIHTRISNIIVMDTDTLNADSIVAMLTTVAKEMEVSISLELFDNIQHLESYIKFFRYFSIHFEAKPAEWMEGLNDCIGTLDRLKNWFKFLSDIYDKYSQYDVQADIPKYNVKDIGDWGKLGKAQGIYITRDNFRDFINKQSFTTAKLTGHKDFPSEFELNVLNDLLQVTLMDTSHTVCDEKKALLVVKGHYIGLNDQFNTTDCSFDVKLILIFASHTVFFDKDYVTHGPNIIVVAPKWYVHEMRGINKIKAVGIELLGKDGHTIDEHANPGGNGKPGEDGKPGVPGESAGSFVGFGKVFENGRLLKIKSVGGNGGPGQNGGDGDGTCDRPTGEGGAGGHGGKGGFHGDINIFELADKSFINVYRLDGEDGENGENGDEGQSKICEGFEYKPRITDGMLPKKLPDLDASIYIGEYFAFMRENQIQKLKRDDVLSFVHAISTDTNVIASCTLEALVNELLILEGEYFRLNGKIELQNYYYWFSLKIEKMLNTSTFESHEKLKVISYLYTSAWGKYVALKTQPFLITDIQSYLDASIRNIEKVNKAQRQQIIDDRKKQYKDQIMSKIDEANDLINSDILPEIDNVKDELNTNMNTLVEETKRLQDEINQNILEYKNQLAIVNRRMRANLVFGAMQAIGTFASCLGPYGMAAGMVINGVSMIGQSFMDGRPAIQAARSIPAGVKTTLEGAKHVLTTRREKRLKLLNQQLERIDEKLSEHRDEFEDTLKQIHQVREQLQDKNSLKDIDASEKKVKNLIDQKKDLMLKNPSGRGKAALKAIKGVSIGMTVLDASMDVYAQYKDDENDLNTINEAMDTSKENLDSLTEFEKSIHSDIWPMLTDMLDDINKIENASSDSHVSIDVKRFKIQSWLRDTKFQMHKYMKGFETEEDMMQTFVKFDDVYLILMNLYDRIDDYRDQAQLADFVSDISSSNVESIQVNDPNLNAIIHRLDVIINSNVLLDQYKVAVDAFKHTVFPFANYYLKYYELPTNLQVDDFSMLVTQAKNQLGDLQNKYKEYNKAIINENDQYIMEATFTNGKESSEPFYEWHFENHGKAIEQLLSGKSVKIRADIQRGVAHNAVKFNQIKLVFSNSNPSTQGHIDKKLLNFDVSMTHMGNSYYRCGSTYYMIHSPATVIMYSNQEMNGRPLRYNTVYTKLLSGDILLSPYSLWTIKLEYHGKGNDQTEFRKLKSLAQGTDLFLVGKGLYVRNDVPVCWTKPAEYKNFEIGI